MLLESVVIGKNEHGTRVLGGDTVWVLIRNYCTRVQAGYQSLLLSCKYSGVYFFYFSNRSSGEDLEFHQCPRSFKGHHMPGGGGTALYPPGAPPGGGGGAELPGGGGGVSLGGGGGAAPGAGL